MKIDEITEEDAKEISEMTKNEFSYTNPSPEKIISRKKQGALIFKAVEENKIAGFVDFEIRGDEAMINGLTVKKEFRGKKIGKTLAVFAVNFLSFKGAKKIMLLVKQENKMAKKLYQKLGFHLTGPYHKKIEGSFVEQMELKINKAVFH